MKWVNSLSFISRLWGQVHDYTVEFKGHGEQYPSETRFVVWLNPYWGGGNPIRVPFEESEAYLMNKDKVDALSGCLRSKKSYTTRLADMLENYKTFR